MKAAAAKNGKQFAEDKFGKDPNYTKYFGDSSQDMQNSTPDD